MMGQGADTGVGAKEASMRTGVFVGLQVETEEMGIYRMYKWDENLDREEVIVFFRIKGKTQRHINSMKVKQSKQAK